MIREEDVVQIGAFTKTHGIAGELAISLLNDLFEKVDPDYIICNMDGILVPFFMEEYRFISDDTAFIKLVDVDTENKARRFVDVSVFLEKKVAGSQQDDFNHYSWENFKGFLIVDAEVGKVGEVLAVDESTLNALFQVQYAGRDLLIPVDESLVDWVDYDKKIIQMHLPEGLLTL